MICALSAQTTTPAASERPLLHKEGRKHFLKKRSKNGILRALQKRQKSLVKYGYFNNCYLYAYLYCAVCAGLFPGYFFGKSQENRLSPRRNG